MKLGLINSAWFGSTIGTAEGIQKTKEIGFDTIDIFADPLTTDPRERRLIKDTAHAANLPIVSTICCALGIGDFNLSVRRFHIERAKRHLDLAYDFEAKNVLLVLGEYIWQKEIITPAEQWAWTVESVRELGLYATNLGLEIAIELEPFHLSVINNIQQMVEFLEEVAVPAVKANLDLSHLTLTHTAVQDIAKLTGRLAHVHLSDCDGKVHGDLPPGRGVVNFPSYLSELKKTQFNGTISIELEYSPNPDNVTEWVSEAYRETNSLMAQFGMRN